MKGTLEKLLHTDVDVELKQGKSGLPMYLTAGRVFYEVRLMGASFYVVELKNTDKSDIRKLKSGMTQYEKSFGRNVAYCVSDLSSRKRDALISNGIPFIAPPGQIFLPFLGLVLQNRFPKEKTEIKKMSPLEQLLFLFLLYDEKSFTKARLADALNVTRAAVTKVTEALRSKGLITEKRSGKEAYVSLSGSQRHCYDEAKKWMQNPVSRVVYCADKAACSGFLKSGETALSEISMLSAPRNEIRACYEKDVRLSLLELIEDDRWENNRELVRLELWKYDPGLLSTGDIVDMISMALSLSDTNDERVQGELQSVMEDKGWQ